MIANQVGIVVQPNICQRILSCPNRTVVNIKNGASAIFQGVYNGVMRCPSSTVGYAKVAVIHAYQGCTIANTKKFCATAKRFASAVQAFPPALYDLSLRVRTTNPLYILPSLFNLGKSGVEFVGEKIPETKQCYDLCKRNSDKIINTVFVAGMGYLYLTSRAGLTTAITGIVAGALVMRQDSARMSRLAYKIAEKAFVCAKAAYHVGIETPGLVGYGTFIGALTALAFNCYEGDILGAVCGRESISDYFRRDIDGLLRGAISASAGAFAAYHLSKSSIPDQSNQIGKLVSGLTGGMINYGIPSVALEWYHPTSVYTSALGRLGSYSILGAALDLSGTGNPTAYSIWLAPKMWYAPGAVSGTLGSLTLWQFKTTMYVHIRNIVGPIFSTLNHIRKERSLPSIEGKKVINLLKIPLALGILTLAEPFVLSHEIEAASSLQVLAQGVISGALGALTLLTVKKSRLGS